MISREKISVVVPCYNVEKYVEKCIDSLIAQTYENIEIIVIDDKSTDNTYEILKDLYKKYNKKFILLQNEKNGGLAYTRNVGIKIATGKYIGFIDSDDYVDKDYYNNLVEQMIQDDADLVVNDIQLVDENYQNIAPVTIACNGKINKKNIVDNGLAASACNKILRKDLLEKYPFYEGKINEDIASVLPVVIHSNKVTYTNKSVYNYVQRKGSIQNSTFSEKRFDTFDSVNLCLERIKDVEDYNTYKDVIILHQILEVYIYILIEIDDEEKRKYLIDKFIEKIKEYDFEVWNITGLNAFIKRHRKNIRLYYYQLIMLLKKGDVEKINKKINFRNNFKTNLKKLIGKNKENGKYTIEELKKLAERQKKLKDESIKVSVVVPNYNYEKFLIRRVYSILYQTSKIYELIILDDCSNDNSRKLIDNIYDALKDTINIRKVYNEKNSGGAFPQWAKGITEASGDYVWIAEADDYCNKNMLKELLKPLKNNENIRIAYVDTAFTDKKGNIFLKTIKPEIDIMKTGHWDNDYINDGKEEIANYTFLNNTIANVSSCIIKKDDYSDIYEEIEKYRQSGDWIFYLNVMAKGKIAYVNKTLNYYRVHDSQITSQMKKEKHLEEIKNIYNMISNKFGSNDFQEREREKRLAFLKEVWNIDEGVE